MANTPQFISTAILGFARPTMSNAACDGSGALDTLLTASGSGTRVDRVSIINTTTPYGAVAATGNALRLFLTDTSGLNPRLINEVLVPTSAVRSSILGTSAFTSIYFPGGLYMASGQILKLATSNYNGGVNQVDVVAYGGNM